ncbi:MAG: hypothetical protein EOP84_07020 [Verrucomicrobiaceae bacterium]|nr:MAG: hypothetical protein EOP84_07020 [Verrucomicrobiaceae bacterium]
MKIFKISHSSDAPGVHAVPDPGKFVKEVLFKLRQVGPDAEIGPFQLAEHDKVRAPFYKVSDSVLLFSEQVLLSPLGSILGFSGNVHFTSLLDSGEPLFFLNVTALYNCLNAPKTLFRGLDGDQLGVDSQMGVSKYSFFSNLIGDSEVFKIPQVIGAIFFACRSEDRCFQTLYGETGFKGLTFEQVWED